jgi:hypothetical protein
LGAAFLGLGCERGFAAGRFGFKGGGFVELNSTEGSATSAWLAGWLVFVGGIESLATSCVTISASAAFLFLLASAFGLGASRLAATLDLVASATAGLAETCTCLAALLTSQAGGPVGKTDGGAFSEFSWTLSDEVFCRVSLARGMELGFWTTVGGSGARCVSFSGSFTVVVVTSACGLSAGVEAALVVVEDCCALRRGLALGAAVRLPGLSVL